MTPNADESAAILTRALIEQQPVKYVRIGDGAIECILGLGKAGKTCDGEVYSPRLAKAMSHALIDLLAMGERIYWGDWRGATRGSRPQYCRQWEMMVKPDSRSFLDFEALLLMRESDELKAFFEALRKDNRRKVYVGPHWAKRAAEWLQAKHLVVPERDLLNYGLLKIADSVIEAEPEIIMWGAGLAGTAAIVDHMTSGWPPAAYLHLGSALDPISGRRTRSNQLEPARARAFLGVK